MSRLNKTSQLFCLQMYLMLYNFLFTSLPPMAIGKFVFHLFKYWVGFEIWTCPSRTWMVEKRSVWKWYRFQIGSENRKPDHLKSRQMAAILSKTVWSLDKNAWILNGLVFQMVGKVQICKGPISDSHCTVGIRLTDVSGNRMVETCPIAEWSGNRMV